MRAPLSGLIHFISFLACVNLLDTHYTRDAIQVLTIGIIGNAVFVVRDCSLESKGKEG